MKYIVIILSFIAFLSIANASDMAKEARWKEQVVGDLFDGEPIVLNDAGQSFLGLIIEGEHQPKRALVVMHGIGVHPDWPQIINPVRVQMAEQGWSTLSIQLPVLGNQAQASDYEPLVAEAAPRIEAAVDYLRNQGNNDIYLVAHSMGTRMTSHYLAKTKEIIKGFVGIGMNRGASKYLSEIDIPLLDIYGSEDEVNGVISSADDRATASQNNAAYTQKVVAGADHFFNDMDDVLISEITAWLAKN